VTGAAEFILAGLACLAAGFGVGYRAGRGDRRRSGPVDDMIEVVAEPRPPLAPPRPQPRMPQLAPGDLEYLRALEASGELDETAVVAGRLVADDLRRIDPGLSDVHAARVTLHILAFAARTQRHGEPAALWRILAATARDLASIERSTAP
jgi:hypothetical protein